MTEHAIDSMIYAWTAMKEKEATQMIEYINFGKVVNVSASVPVAANDTVYHIIIDFVPNRPEIFDSFHTDMGKILEWPDDYVLCNVSDIKELEDLEADLNEHIKNLERIKEFLINGNTTLINENSKLKATNQALKDRIKELEAKWSAMLQALKEKGVEVIYMGEEDDKPNIDVKIPEIGDLKKELEDLKSKTVAEARYEFKPGCLTFIFTMCDGSEQVFGMDSSEAIDATSISCGTVPKCSSCAHYMHNPSRFTHDWCYMPCPKEGGAGYIRKLNKEEAEGPACSDFKARKEN